MTLLGPIALFGLLLVPLLVIFYLFRPDPKRSGSTTYFLWAAAAPDSQGGTFANRLQNNPLLWLQILIILILVLFLARPSLPWKSQVPRSQKVIVVVDRSASMACGGAFEKALAKAEEAGESMLGFKLTGSTPEVMLIAVDKNPTVIVPFTKDLSQYNEGLNQLRLTDSEDDLEGMRPFFQSLLKAHKAQVWLLGDRLPEQLHLPGLQFTSVAQTGETNVGIVSFSVNPPEADRGQKKPFLYARVENFSKSAQQRVLKLEKLSLDNPDKVQALVLERSLLLPADSGQTIVEALSATRFQVDSNSLFRLRLEVVGDQVEDPFPTDDQAYTVVAPFQSDKIVVATGPGVQSSFLLRAIAASSGVRVAKVSDLLQLPTPPVVDLLLAAGEDTPPSKLKVRSRFILAPAPEKGEGKVAKLKLATDDAPLVSESGVEWTRHKVQITDKTPPAGDETVLLDSSEGPALTLSGLSGGLPTLRWRFPLSYSSLPLSPGLPIVVGRFIDTFSRASTVPVNGSLTTSGDLLRPVGTAWKGELLLEPFSNRPRKLYSSDQVPAEASLVASPPVAGFYQMSSFQSKESAPIAVNLFSYSEGRLPRQYEDQAFPSDFVTEDSSEKPKEETRYREIELPFLILAFLLLLIEAAVFLKRGRP